IIPFTAEIVCDSAAYARKADCLTSVAEATVTAQVDEERGRCNLRFAAQLAFAGSFIEEKEVEVVTDAFCCGAETIAEEGREYTPVCEDIKEYTERVSGACATGVKIDYGCSFKVAASPKAECTYSPDTGLLEGAVKAVLVFTRDGEFHSTDVTFPFSVKLNGLYGDPRIDVAVIGISVRQRSEGECEAEATLKIAAANYLVRECLYISELEAGEAIDSYPAVTVLAPEKGDTLWSVAKKLKRSPQDITASCPSLAFPLSGDEKVVIYRPKTV
ncbi:MAG: hypothetical protein LUD27_00050, partial [Clostridia bacterium]|nr:hypothetical protein [Clostridia bacterium]